MNKLLLLLLFSCLNACNAQEQGEAGRADKLRSLFERAARHTGVVKDHGEARIVGKGAKPEIILRAGKVTFNGRELRFGAPLAQWRQIIGAGSLCSAPEKKPGWCKWDALGIEIVGALERPDGIGELRVHLSRNPDAIDVGNLPTMSGKPRPNPVWLSTGTFPGFLAIDTFGVDARTKFREIRRNVSADYHLECKMLRCDFPEGSLGDGLVIAMALSGNSEDETVRKVTVYKLFTDE